MSNETYVLAPGEEVILELNIEAPFRGTNNVVKFGAVLAKLLFSSCAKSKAPAVLVVTNMRVLVTNRPECCGSRNRFFWSYPRTALNGDNSFAMIAGCCSCCDSYTFTIGLKLRTTESISFDTPDVRSVEQAQALIAKLFQLSQND